MKESDPVVEKPVETTIIPPEESAMSQVLSKALEIAENKCKEAMSDLLDFAAKQLRKK